MITLTLLIIAAVFWVISTIALIIIYYTFSGLIVHNLRYSILLGLIPAGGFFGFSMLIYGIVRIILWLWGIDIIIPGR